MLSILYHSSPLRGGVREGLLSERFAQQLDFDGGADAFVENVIDGIENGHVDVQVLVDVLHALCCEVALGNHLHLELGALDAIPLPYHRSEDTIATEIRVARHEQVACIDAFGDATVNWVNGVEEAFHLLNGVADEDGLEVVAVLESVTDTCCDGIDVLQDAGVLDANHVVAGLRLHIIAGKHLGKSFRLFLVGTSNSQVCETIQRDLLSMTRTSKHSQIILRHIVHLVEVVGADEVLVGHDAFDGCHDELVAKADVKALEVTLQVRRGRDEDKCLASLNRLVDVALEGDAVHVEMHAGKVSRIVPEPLKVLDAVVPAKVPPNVVILLEQHLGDCRCPASATQNCYVS